MTAAPARGPFAGRWCGAPMVSVPCDARRHHVAGAGVPVLLFRLRVGPDQSLASMDNGSGDEYSITFTGSGVFLRGFAHEAPLSPWVQDPPALWPGILAGLPAEFTALAREPAFAPDDGVPAITVALWRQPGDGQWHYGRISYPPVRENQYSDFDGSDALFAQLGGRAESYLEYAS